MNKTQTRTAEIYLDGNGILHLIMISRVVIDLEDAIDNFLVIRQLTNNQPHVRLIDARKPFRIDRAAKHYIDDKGRQANTKARAILVQSGLSRSTANFFIKFNSNKIPTQFFTNYNEAIQWLITFQ